jgi:hypothetical protein
MKQTDIHMMIALRIRRWSSGHWRLVTLPGAIASPVLPERWPQAPWLKGKPMIPALTQLAREAGLSFSY